MKQFAKTIFVVLVLMLLALPAAAGRHVLRYEENGQVSVSIFTDRNGREKILFRALPLTGDRTPGPAVMRFDGVYVAQWSAPTYEFEFALDADSVPSLQGDKDGKLVIDWLKVNPKQQVDLRRLTVGVHTVEIYFASADGKGKLDRNRTAAPATQFRVEAIEADKVATTKSGDTMDADQLDAAIKQSYEQGKNDSASAWEKDRKAMQDQIDRLVAELNELRKKGASTPAATKQPTASTSRGIGFGWVSTNSNLEFGEKKTAEEQKLILGAERRLEKISSSSAIRTDDDYVLVLVSGGSEFSCTVVPRNGKGDKQLSAKRAGNSYEKWLYLSVRDVDSIVVMAAGNKPVVIKLQGEK